MDATPITAETCFHATGPLRVEQEWGLLASCHSLRLIGFVQDLACVLRVLGADDDVVRSDGAQPVASPGPLFVSRGRHSMPASRKTEQSSSALGSLPAILTTTQSP